MPGTSVLAVGFRNKKADLMSPFVLLIKNRDDIINLIAKLNIRHTVPLLSRVKRENGGKPLQPPATVNGDEIRYAIGKLRRPESKMIHKVRIPAVVVSFLTSEGSTKCLG
jgi:hypothetical protein